MTIEAMNLLKALPVKIIHELMNSFAILHKNLNKSESLRFSDSLAGWMPRLISYVPDNFKDTEQYILKIIRALS